MSQQPAERRPRYRWRGASLAAAAAALLIALCLWVAYYGGDLASPFGGGRRRNGRDDTVTEAELPRFKAAAALIDPELMGHAPSAYDEAYGNPCWQAAGGAGLRCLPAFFISGSFNGGGSLGRFVAAHPDVAFDAGTLSSWGRSWSYWSEYRNQMGAYLSGISSAAGTALTADPVRTRVMDGGHNTMSLYWAASGKAHRAFAGVAVACWARCHKLDASSGAAYERCMDTECLPAGRAADAEAASNASIAYEDMQLPMLMRSLYGDRLPKFVFVLREPAERVYSAYKGTKELVAAYGNTTNSFISYARDQMKAWTACVAAHGEHACMWHFETLSMEQEKVFYHCDQVLRGLYDEWLKVWFRFFPRENFLFINSHNYFRDPNATRKEVLEFLGLRTPDDATLAVMANASAPVSNVDGPFDWIPEGARRLLQKHIFESHTTKLAKLLAKQGEGPGDDSYDMWDNWNRNDWNRRRGR